MKKLTEENIKKHHKIINNKVCCVGHLCDWHYKSVEKFKKKCLLNNKKNIIKR